MKSTTQILAKNKNHILDEALPIIPDKRYFTIGEVADLCFVKTHVLRYWEQEFTQLKPTKRRGNRRFYLFKDVMIVRRIRKLLYEQGFTIEGAKSQLQLATKPVPPLNTDPDVVKNLIADLENVLDSLKTCV